jgi:hypothetical protein
MVLRVQAGEALSEVGRLTPLPVVEQHRYAQGLGEDVLAAVALEPVAQRESFFVFAHAVVHGDLVHERTQERPRVVVAPVAGLRDPLGKLRAPDCLRVEEVLEC